MSDDRRVKTRDSRVENPNQCSLCCWTWKIIAPGIHDVVRRWGFQWKVVGMKKLFSVDAAELFCTKSQAPATLKHPLENRTGRSLKTRESERCCDTAAAAAEIMPCSDVFYSVLWRPLMAQKKAATELFVFPVHEVGKNCSLHLNFIYWIVVRRINLWSGCWNIHLVSMLTRQGSAGW